MMDDVLTTIISNNIKALSKMIDYNIKNRVQVFRISSDIIPFASHPLNHLKWQEIFKEEFKIIGDKIKVNGLRVSVHPGQYTVLNSPDRQIVENAIQELTYNAVLLDMLGVDSTNKIIIHIGGAYKSKTESKDRFINNYKLLPECVKERLIIENDEKIYTPGDVLNVAEELGIPAVFDVLHFKLNNDDTNVSEYECIRKFSSTWKEKDGVQKIHYSQQSRTNKKLGAHSDTIYIKEFMDFYNGLENKNIDIMLEVKDKNVSAIKCINAIENLKPKYVEEEWARYKYKVLEKSQNQYKEIREYLKNKNGIDAVEFYDRVEKAIFNEKSSMEFINSSMHVWGYFKDISLSNEKNKFNRLVQGFENRRVKEFTVKNFLYKLAFKYDVKYLLDSYYFVDIYN
jgi:UV DNA damage endonuclease